MELLFSHSTMYVNEIIMNAAAEFIQGFILLMLHPVSGLVESGTAIFVFVKVRERRLFSVCTSHMHQSPLQRLRFEYIRTAALCATPVQCLRPRDPQSHRLWKDL